MTVYWLEPGSESSLWFWRFGVGLMFLSSSTDIAFVKYPCYFFFLASFIVFLEAQNNYHEIQLTNCCLPFTEWLSTERKLFDCLITSEAGYFYDTLTFIHGSVLSSSNLALWSKKQRPRVWVPFLFINANMYSEKFSLGLLQAAPKPILKLAFAVLR